MNINLPNQFSIETIAEPQDYFVSIKNHVKTSSSRIVLSALYFGCGSTEKELITILRERLQENTELKVTIILDYSRAHRLSNRKSNSLTMLQPLLNEFHPRFKLKLFQMPQLRDSLMQNLLSYSQSLSAPISNTSKPIISSYQNLLFQLSEIIGVYHCKFCIFDNNVILTGANLSHEYFTTRLDRYVIFNNNNNNNNNKHNNNKHHNHEFILQYLIKFTDILSLHSHDVNSNLILTCPTQSIQDLSSQLLTISDQIIDENNNNYINSIPNIQNNIFSKINGNNNAIIPMIQLKSIGIKQEELFLTQLLSYFMEYNKSTQKTTNNNHYPRGIIRIASPYTSFKATFMSQLISARMNEIMVSIINPALECHGFYHATGLKGYVPLLHEQALQQSFHESKSFISNNNNNNNNNSYNNNNNNNNDFVPRILKYNKPGWTFHTKGIWVYDVNNNDKNNSYDHNSNDINYPILTYIGSSNFGDRSWTRDFELGFLLNLNNNNMHDYKQLFHQEYINIEKFCKISSISDIHSNYNHNKSSYSLTNSIKNIKNNIFHSYLLPRIVKLIRSYL
eukprot:gene9042-12191_t